MIEATVDTFEELAASGPVLVDIWGPQCQPCLALMPAVETLAERYGDRVRFLSVNAPDNRKVCRDLRVAGLPAYLTMRDGVEVERLTSNGTTPEQIEAAIQRLLDGAPAVGPPVPEHLRQTTWTTQTLKEVTRRMELEGKRVIALGERDSVPGEAIAAVARSAGAEVIETRTECFVWTASGAMDPDNQALIKRIVEERGAEGIVVILGAADAEAVEVAAETVRDGDPAWVGPLAGVQLGLPVLHVFEDEVKAQADPATYEAEIGFFAMTLDVEEVNKAMKRARGEG